MRQLIVNGIEHPLPEAASFGDLLETVKRDYVNEQAWITSVHVNGDELKDWDEDSHRGRTAEDIASLEVRLSPPNLIVAETLETLVEFTDHLVAYSREAAQALRDGSAGRAELDHLLQNLGVFTESLNGVKRILGGEACQETAIIEVDLLSILSDTLEFYQQGQYAYAAEMLESHLPSNLTEWRDQGLPALAAARPKAAAPR
ncbi:MAG: hypothetical protein NDJ90_15510 [Oligoflexia bacterium]|nr:hypothetical protein [Oligoflexia bacterium]